MKISVAFFTFFLILALQLPIVHAEQTSVGLSTSSLNKATVSRLVRRAARRENMRAFSRIRNGKSYAILKIGSKESIMTSEKAPNYAVDLSGLSYRKFSFSPGGRYVLFAGVGWEWEQGYIYDRIEQKIHEAESPGTFVITPDDSTLISCAANHFSAVFYGKLQKLPETKEIFSYYDAAEVKEIDKKYTFTWGLNCVYDTQNRTVVFTGIHSIGAVQGQAAKKVVVTVDPQSGKVQDISTSDTTLQ